MYMRIIQYKLDFNNIKYIYVFSALTVLGKGLGLQNSLRCIKFDLFVQYELCFKIIVENCTFSLFVENYKYPFIYIITHFSYLFFYVSLPNPI